jgi:hypothetical protein
MRKYGEVEVQLLALLNVRLGTTLCTCIQEVIGSNLGRHVGYSHGGL